ncbi:hypothetical protein FI667_g5969, partial [Globisporangium splendens]
MPSPTATSTQEELQASATSYAREILEFDRPTAVLRPAGLVYKRSLASRKAPHGHQISRRNEKRINLDTGLRVFADIMSLGTTEIAGVAATSTVRVPYEEEETYTEDITEYRLNMGRFQQWVLSARQEVNAFFQRSDYAFVLEQASNRDEIQQVEALLQRIEERIAQLEQSSARHEQFEHLRHEFRQQVEQDQLTSQQVRNVVAELHTRMNDMEQMQRDGVVINDEDFNRWAGTPMRAI